MSASSRLKTTKIIGQRNAFYRQRIPEFYCARGETVDIDILVTTENNFTLIPQNLKSFDYKYHKICVIMTVHLLLRYEFQEAVIIIKC